MPEKSWSQVVSEVVDASIQREKEEAKHYEREVNVTLNNIEKIPNEELIELFWTTAARGFSNVEKVIAKQRFLDGMKEEILERMSNAR